MKIAIMQPYIYPYIGYFQLINLVDVFVFYDDVNFIKRGYINRNYILNNNERKGFVVPCKKISQNKKINEVQVLFDDKNKQKFLNQLNHSYSKAPYFEDVYFLIESFLSSFTDVFVSQMAIGTVKTVCNYLGIETKFKKSSEFYSESTSLRGSDRILHICKKELAQDYINPIGGKELYDKSVFKKEQIRLNFIKSNKTIYKQYDNDFVPFLSVIDVMMFNSVGDIQKMLNDYELI